ncbi:MAG: spore coat protein GerQ [Bacilli bacterium]|jgi:spore germination protein Q
MNNNYSNPVFPNQPPNYNRQLDQQPTQQPIPPQFIPAGTAPGTLPLEQSFIENILRLNIGKVITVHMSFTDSAEKDKVFTGVLEDAGIDHIILSDPKTGTWYLLKSIYLNYITTDERINFIPRVPVQQ